MNEMMEETTAVETSRMIVKLQDADGTRTERHPHLTADQVIEYRARYHANLPYGTTCTIKVVAED